MARRDRTDLTPASALSVILATMVGIAGALLAVHWMSCSQAEGVAMCSAVITPLKTGRWAWVTRLQAYVRAACLRTELGWEESALDQMEEVQRQLPEEIRHQRARIGARRVQLIEAESSARGQA